jgi:hypothetical protein
MARLTLNSGESVGLSSGTYNIFGTSAGKETVTIAAAATVTLDASFNAGGDTVTLAGNAADYTAVRSGSSLILTHTSGGVVTIPVGTTASTVAFADASRSLVFNTTSSAVELGSQAVTSTAAAVSAGTGGSAAGQTFTLTSGADRGADFVGTDGDDTFFADEEGATVMNLTDVIDGGAGTDTLNILVQDDGALANFNGTLAGSYKNVEIINIDNTLAIAGTPAANGGTGHIGELNAGAFVGATQVWQIAQATDVYNLAATAAAGFSGIELGDTAGAANITVAAAATATTATVALDGAYSDTAAATDLGTETSYLAVSGASLNKVVVSGELGFVDPTSTLKFLSTELELDVTVGASAAGKSVSAVTVVSDVYTVLTVNKGGTSGAVSTVDASGSAGGIEFVGDADTATIKTGSGADTVTYVATLAVDNPLTSANEAVNGVISTGDGSDSIKLGGYTSVAGTTLTVSAGAGNDTVSLVTQNSAAETTSSVFLNTLTSTTVLDGGVGTSDTLVIDATEFDDGGANLSLSTTYSRLAKATGFETLSLAGDATKASTNVTTIDASKVTNFARLSFSTDDAVVTKLSAAQTITGKVAIDATATGYAAATATAATTYAGTINATATSGTSQALTLQAKDATIAVTAATSSLGAVSNVASTVDGDLKSLTVTLASKRGIDPLGVLDFGKGATSNLGNEATATITVTTDSALADGLTGLNSIKVSGTGVAVIDNEDGYGVGADLTPGTADDTAALLTIDVSGMTAFVNLDADGEQVDGVGFGYENLSTTTITTSAVLAETIKLGGALDTVVSVGSSVDSLDVISGFELTAVPTSATTLDAAKSDVLDIDSFVADVGRITVTASTLEGALEQAGAFLGTAAAVAANNYTVVFNFGGNTYVYADTDTSGGLTDADYVIKMVGELNTALLAQSII